MSVAGLLNQLLQSLLVVALAPLVLGWVNQCRAWLTNRSGPGVLQPYRALGKLFLKDAAIPETASWIFRFTPYLLFGAMALAGGVVPVLATDLPLAPAADVIALVGLFAMARVFASLAAMDAGTAFGTLGARREMFIGALAEPAMLIVFFNLSLISQSTQITSIVETLAHRELVLQPSLAFAAAAFVMVALAENARVPVDNPATHLELTMIHEAMILEYSARHLALIEWAAAIKLTVYMSLGVAFFLPWGIAEAGDWGAFPLALASLALKFTALGFALALVETLNAKLRIFRAPEFVATAFLLAMLGFLLHFVLVR
jgi:formate hydrogenlyase subunit 4